MASFASLFGSTLKGKDGDVDTAAATEGKTVAIYFSAHWCPPCRGFTPKLAEYYTTSLKAKGMEVVFVSSDKDVEAFNDYYKDMPWLALPFEERDKKNQLSKKCKVKGIPSLVILGKDGSIITADGRSKIMADPKGENFPWTPKPFAEVIGDTFLNYKQDTVSKDVFAGKTLGIYFSAHWCPPCRRFTPQLASAYKKYKEKGLEFEVIFVSADHDSKTFSAYFGDMAEKGGEWLAIPFADEKRRKEVGELFDIEGYPSLVIVDKTGKVINSKGRGAILDDPAGEKFPWMPPLVKDLKEPDGIDENLSIAVLMEALPAEQQAEIAAQLGTVAKKYAAQAEEKGEDPKYFFFMAKTSEGAVPKVRELCKLGLPPSSVEPEAKKAKTSPLGLVRSASNDLAPAAAQMLLFDLENKGTYYLSDAAEVTAKSVEDFIAAFEAGSLTAKRVGE